MAMILKEMKINDEDAYWASYKGTLRIVQPYIRDGVRYFEFCGTEYNTNQTSNSGWKFCKVEKPVPVVEHGAKLMLDKTKVAIIEANLYSGMYMLQTHICEHDYYLIPVEYASRFNEDEDFPFSSDKKSLEKWLRDSGAVGV